jgi:membrane protease YdiL (CAAX protease family)
MDSISDPIKPPTGFRLLIEPPLVLLLAFCVSILLGVLGFMGTALVVESDPIGALIGVERKLDIRLTPKEAEALPSLEDTRGLIVSIFDKVDVIVVPEGENTWRLQAWIDGDPAGDTFASLAPRLDELGWDGAVPRMTTQPRYSGVAENPRRMRAYVPPAMTLQALSFIFAAWVMIRWRKPRGFERRASPVETIAWAIAAAVVAFGTSTLLGGLLQLTGLEVEEQAWIQALMSDRSVLLVVMPWLVLVGPVSEEVFFRGYVFRRVWSSSGPRAAYALSALLFALIHWHPIGVPMYALIGLVFCWVYRKTGSLWAPVVAHVVYNGIVVSIPLLVAPGG